MNRIPLVLSLCGAAILVCPAACAAARGPDWQRETDRAARLLQRYLQLDTTNPPGNEMITARFLAERLAEVGITAEIAELAPGRANLVARLKGDGSARPLVLTHHMDVVGAEPAAWRHPPFSGALVDGEIWGRGALDMKGTGIVHLAVMLLLAEQKVPLARDVIFLALADEEEDSLGAIWVREQRPEWVAGAEFLLNEGATAVEGPRGPTQFNVATLEKGLLWLELVARGPAGHGSTPIAGSATNRLLAALGRLSQTQRPVRLLDAVEKYFAGQVSRVAPAMRPKVARLGQHLADAAFLAELTADPLYNALLRDTVAITVLAAGEKANVIPGEARARLDCRLLPGTDRQEFLTWLAATLADPQIELIERLAVGTQASPTETELMQAIRATAAAIAPGAPVVPLPLTSTTDSSLFRAMGIHAYGFEPFPLTDADLLLQHGHNERLAVDDLGYGLRFTYEVVKRLAARSR